MYLTRNEKKKERERERGRCRPQRVSLFSKSFPSFSFFLPLFPLFRAPFWGDFFFLFFVLKMCLGLQKEAFFLVVVVVVGKGFIFFFVVLV